MKYLSSLLLVLLCGFPLVAGTQTFTREVEPQSLIDDARAVLAEMIVREEYEPLVADLREAHGVLIFPRVIRGGFFVGGSGGLGVYAAWDRERRDFSPVAFFSLGAVSLGLQFGAEVAEVVVVARTQNAADSLFSTTTRLGGDASVAAGPVGAGRRASVTADFVSYARSKGAFIGMSLEGSQIRAREDFNEAYYDRPLRAVEIIEGWAVDRPGTRSLRNDLLRLRTAAPRVESTPSIAPAAEPAADVGARPVPHWDPLDQGSGGLTIEEIQVENR